MLSEMKEGYKFFRYERYRKDGIGRVLSLYFFYIPTKNHLYVYNDDYYWEQIEYIERDNRECGIKWEWRIRNFSSLKLILLISDYIFDLEASYIDFY